jgi:hypothetical protein
MIALWHMRTVAKRSEPNQLAQANRHIPKISFSLLNVSRMKKFSRRHTYYLFLFYVPAVSSAMIKAYTRIKRSGVERHSMPLAGMQP